MWKIRIESKKQMVLCHYRVQGAHPICKGLMELDGTSQMYATIECGKSTKSIKNQVY